MVAAVEWCWWAVAWRLGGPTSGSWYGCYCCGQLSCSSALRHQWTPSSCLRVVGHEWQSRGPVLPAGVGRVRPDVRPGLHREWRHRVPDQWPWPTPASGQYLRTIGVTLLYLNADRLPKKIITIRVAVPETDPPKPAYFARCRSRRNDLFGVT